MKRFLLPVILGQVLMHARAGRSLVRYSTVAAADAFGPQAG